MIGAGTPAVSADTAEVWTLNTDGGARGNPGPAGAGAVLTNPQGKVVKKVGKYLGTCTNNEAEYRALILGLDAAINLGTHHLSCYLDSELIVRQLNGEYKVKNANMKKFWAIVKTLEGNFESVKYSHILRDKNAHADEIVNQVLDGEYKVQ